MSSDGINALCFDNLVRPFFFFVCFNRQNSQQTKVSKMTNKGRRKNTRSVSKSKTTICSNVIEPSGIVFFSPNRQFFYMINGRRHDTQIWSENNQIKKGQVGSRFAIYWDPTIIGNDYAVGPSLSSKSKTLNTLGVSWSCWIGKTKDRIIELIFTPFVFCNVLWELLDKASFSVVGIPDMKRDKKGS